MKSTIKYIISFAIALFFLASCANMKTAKMVPDTKVKDLSPKYLAGEVTSKVDGWVVLLDASLSMRKPHEDYVKFDIAKAFVERMNQTLPPISAVSGLRTFGHAPQISSKDTQLVYGMTAFDRKKMGEGISQVNQPGGPTPMSAAINGATADLKNVRGNKAVIIVSDGKDLDNSPVLAAKKMLAQLGDNVCIYTVLVGDDKDGKILMENIAKVSTCGFMVSALDIVPANPMANYVSDVFLTGKDVGLGYHKAVSLIKPLSNLHFDFNDHRLTQKSKSLLDKNIKVLMDNPNIKLTIEGHASAKGTTDYNQRLSEKRAETVRNYLISKGNLTSDRLRTTGLGETQPQIQEHDPELMDSPAAKLNRRVVLEVVKE